MKSFNAKCLALSQFDRNHDFIFSGTAEEKQKTIVVQFDSNSTIQFIPLKIFTEFLKINGIILKYSRISVLKEGFFTEEFESIQYLHLGYKGMREVQKDALIYLTELKWIMLGWNRIEYLKTNIFKTNLKLEFIYLQRNSLQMINPKLFTNLNKLIEVAL
jgi:hypothetical protein